MTFSSGGSVYAHIGNVDQAGADALTRVSIAGGVNFFDTAKVYSHGESETMLGQSFRNLAVARNDVALATKGYMRRGPGRNDVGASRGHIDPARRTPQDGGAFHRHAAGRARRQARQLVARALSAPPSLRARERQP